MGRYSIQTLRGGCGSRSVGGKDLVEINEEGGKGGKGGGGGGEGGGGGGRGGGRGVGARKVEG